MMTRRRLSTLLAAALSVLVVAISLGRISAAGFAADTDTGSGWETGRVTLTDDDSGNALFDSATTGLLDGGQTETRCIAVTYTGTTTTDIGVRLHATASGALAPHLDLTVDEGTGGGAGTCAGFTPTETLYTGTLAGFAADHNSFATGASTWAVTATPQTRTYRFTVTVRNETAAQDKAAVATFAWTAAKVTFSPALLGQKALWLRAADLSAGAASTWVNRANGEAFTAQGTTNPAVIDGATPVGGKAVRFPTTTVKTSYFRGNVPLAAVSGVSASTEQGGFESWRAVDGANGDGWASAASFPTPTFAGFAWLSMQVRPGSTVTGYTIKPLRSDRIPKDWTFEGSDDKSAWTVLDTQSIPASATGQTYTLAAPATYRYYRLYITSVNSGNIVHLDNLALVGAAPAATQAEAWVVMRARAGSGETHGLWHTGNGLSQLVPYRTTQMVETFGVTSSGSRPIFNATKGLYAWRLYRVTTDGTTWTADLDGVRQVTQAQNFTTWGTRDWLIGSGVELGYDGDIAEIVIRDRISTPTEAAALTDYFNREHGLSVPVS